MAVAKAKAAVDSEERVEEGTAVGDEEMEVVDEGPARDAADMGTEEEAMAEDPPTYPV